MGNLLTLEHLSQLRILFLTQTHMACPVAYYSQLQVRVPHLTSFIFGGVGFGHRARTDKLCSFSAAAKGVV